MHSGGRTGAARDDPPGLRIADNAGMFSRLLPCLALCPALLLPCAASAMPTADYMRCAAEAEMEAPSGDAGVLAACTRAIQSWLLDEAEMAKATLVRGGLRHEAGDLDGAIDDFSTAIRLRPRVVEPHVGRARTWFDKGEPMRAIADYDAALRLAPSAAILYNARGVVYHRQGDFTRALVNYETAQMVEPDYAVPYNNLAWLYATASDRQFRNGALAVKFATRAAEMSKWQAPEILDTLAAAHAQAGDFAQAMQWQEKALAFPEYASTKGAAARERLARYRDKRTPEE